MGEKIPVVPSTGHPPRTDTDPRPTVTAVIPTRNEESNLRFLLPTLTWCDEVLIVDQKSTDRTREIAEASGAIVLDAPDRPDFDAGRALGAETAAGEWILTLDADEMVPSSLADRLLAAAASGQHDIVAIPRLNYLLAPMRGAGHWPDTQLRFFRRGAVEVGSEVHTFLRPLSERVLRLEADQRWAIHHFAYRSAAGQLQKLNRYTELEANKTADSPPPGNWRAFAWEPTRVFLSRYLKQGGFRQGVPGLWAAVYWAFYYFAKAIKGWERRHLPGIQARELEIRQQLLADWGSPPRPAAEDPRTRGPKDRPIR